MGDVAEVLSAAEARATARAHGDAEGLSRLLHGEFRWTTHTGEIFSRSEYVHRNTEGHKEWRSQDMSNAAVVVVGDTAVLHADVVDVVLSEDRAPETFRMPVTQVWVRLPGGWQCLAGHAGPARS